MVFAFSVSSSRETILWVTQDEPAETSLVPTLPNASLTDCARLGLAPEVEQLIAEFVLARGMFMRCGSEGLQSKKTTGARPK
jgi:hypothetical protein